MTSNILETIQKNLGYPAIDKVDPNSQDAVHPQQDATILKLGQAAIPAVLTALYKFSRTDEGCTQILGAQANEDWLSILYNGNEHEVVEKIAQYASVSPEKTETHMENIADEAVKILNDPAEKPTAEKIKTFMNGQRHIILRHLPADLNMGELLNDESLDDRTNKMEGPVSNLMHKIENIFSGGDDKNKITPSEKW